MAERFLTCPLCGFEFSPDDAPCHHGCPMKSACNLTKCPVCDYEFPGPSRSVSWLEALFGRRRKHKGAGDGLVQLGGDRCLDRGDGLLTVRELAGGESAEVVHLEAEDADRSNALAVFGLVPGCEVTLVQRLPSFVLQIGETMLALDAEVAGSIVVRRAAA
jgi:Fe2+ transport system protein FeoA